MLTCSRGLTCALYAHLFSVLICPLSAHRFPKDSPVPCMLTCSLCTHLFTLCSSVPRVLTCSLSAHRFPEDSPVPCMLTFSLCAHLFSVLTCRAEQGGP